MHVMKLVITGEFGAGKTQFIRTISETEVLSTERKATDEGSALKRETTVAMDFGRITVDQDMVLHLFGTPGQRRFDFMWEILSHGMLGFIVLVDSCRPEAFRETTKLIETFMGFKPAPFVVAATKQDLEGARSPEDIRACLDLDQRVKVLPCVAIDKESVKNVILELLYLILDDLETEEMAPSRPAGRQESPM